MSFVVINSAEAATPPPTQTGYPVCRLRTPALFRTDRAPYAFANRSHLLSRVDRGTGGFK